MGFYTFIHQTGHLVNERPAYIIIEASSLEAAANIFKSKFDYSLSDSYCCGDYAFYKQNPDFPDIYGQTIKEYIESVDDRWDEIELDETEKEIIYIDWKDKDLEKIEINIKEQIKKNAARKRKKADKLWGAVVGPFGINKKPIRFYKDDELGSYWDKTGNNSIRAAGYIKNKDNQVATFASKNKEEVQLFIDGMESCYLQLLYYTEDIEPRNEQEELAVEFIREYLKTLV